MTLTSSVAATGIEQHWSSLAWLPQPELGHDAAAYVARPGTTGPRLVGCHHRLGPVSQSRSLRMRLPVSFFCSTLIPPQQAVDTCPSSVQED
jgi:hypothetical protein